MRLRVLLTPALVVTLVTVLIAWAVHNPDEPQQTPLHVPDDEGLRDTVAKVDQFSHAEWAAKNLKPAPPAEPLQIMRRLSLALHGTIPSLEEIRTFEKELDRPASAGEPDLITRWTLRLLQDHRFADYFAERLARGFVGTEGGAFVIYRRDRFVDWLSEQLAANRPYNEIVRQLICDKGLWTGRPAVNFVTATVADRKIDYNKLTGKTVRAFLGQRIDCAQCHDHPFDHWKQSDYEGLTAFYGDLNVTLVGIEEKPGQQFKVEDRNTLEERVVKPRVPFHPEWLPSDGSLRDRLAAWVTHPHNRRFERAIAHRVWTLLMGQTYYSQRAVDDLPDPPAKPDILDFLGADFRQHGYDLRRLILAVTATERFRMSSESNAETDQEYDLLKKYGCVFPLSRLRPEQLIGSMLQAASVQTIDQNSHLIARTIKFFREQNFVRDYGDLGADELDAHAGTITQALLRMNGQLTREITNGSPLNSTTRVAGLSDTDDECLDNVFLICLTRRPTEEERAYFLDQLRGTKKDQRTRVVEDLYWTLFNSAEFSWNH